VKATPLALAIIVIGGGVIALELAIAIRGLLRSIFRGGK